MRWRIWFHFYDYADDRWVEDEYTWNDMGLVDVLAKLKDTLPDSTNWVKISECRK